MATSQDLLMKPIAWRQPALAPVLHDMQANILKGHGRRHTRQIFFAFDPDRAATLRTALAATCFTSAFAQLDASAQRRLSPTVDGGPVRLLFLSRHGYAALGVAPARTPADPAFVAGMAARPDLGDPPVTAWEPPYRRPVDAMVLVADDTAAGADGAATPIAVALALAGATMIGEESGAAILRDGQGIEHFGYVDGRSQPLMLDDEVNREINSRGEPLAWDPQFGPLQIALVTDPGGASADSFGSYLVYRKLEQNVAGFAAAVEKLADDLELMTPRARQLAGAMVVGRFRDGTPVVMSKRALGESAVANNFSFDGDTGAARCPFQAHIRKTNPRGDSVRAGFATIADERSHLMPRRGIPYGARAADLGDAPAGGVGLLFMAYNRDIAQQFEFVQSHWVNAGEFVMPGTGADPVMGAEPAGHRWPTVWDQPDTGTISADFGGFVTMKGGEYFFAPSLSFIRSLGMRSD